MDCNILIIIIYVYNINILVNGAINSNIILMNLTTQQILRQFQQLTPSQLPSLEQVVKQTMLFALKGVKQLLLLYPINIMLLIIIIYWLCYSLLESFTKPKIQVYSARQHVQAHDQHIKNLKKDIRQIQNQSLNLSRKIQNRRKQRQSAGAQQKQNNTNASTADGNSQQSSHICQQLSSLLQQREYIEQVSKESIAMIKTSQNRFLDKLRRYRR